MSTKDDILDAALTVFAAHGFEAGTVRDICVRAGANVAAVNYHFGDKATLYAKVLEHAHRSIGGGKPMPMAADQPNDPEGQLRLWIVWFLGRMLGAARTPVGQLMAREMQHPTTALDYLVSQSVQPHMSEVEQLIVRCSDVALDERQIRMHAMTIVSQCLVFRSGQAMLNRLDPPHFGVEDIEELATHILTVTMAALRNGRKMHI